MATYNGEKYISKQIESILPQLYVDDEVIVSDNYSTDNTINIIKSYNDKRIKIYIFKRNTTKSYWNKYYNITSNFENAINKSSGDIIILCDQDDIWDKDKIFILKKDLERNDCIFSNYGIIDENDNIINHKRIKKNPIKNPLIVILFPPFIGCTMAINRSLLELCLPFPQRLLLHDIYIGLISYLKKNIYFQEKVLTFYRRHDSNVSTTTGKTKNDLFRIIMWRMRLYFMVFFAILRIKKNKKHE